MDTNLILILAGIGGVLAHCLFKMDGMAKDYQTANIPFNWRKDYWYKDRFGILLSFLSVGLWFLIYQETSDNYEKLQAWKITSFVGMGLFGSYVIQLLMSRGKKKLREIVDVKTNIADGVISLNGDGPGGNPGNPPPTPPPTGPGGPGTPPKP